MSNEFTFIFLSMDKVQAITFLMCLFLSIGLIHRVNIEHIMWFERGCNSAFFFGGGGGLWRTNVCLLLRQRKSKWDSWGWRAVYFQILLYSATTIWWLSSNTHYVPVRRTGKVMTGSRIQFGACLLSFMYNSEMFHVTLDFPVREPLWTGQCGADSHFQWPNH